ncbi:MAG TPA: helix-turn-helix domain-containing protein [Chloroflexota bacterium]
MTDYVDSTTNERALKTARAQQRIKASQTEPWGKLGRRVMEDPRLDKGAKLVYALLTTYADGCTGEAFPIQATLGAALGMDRSTVSKHLAALRAAGYVAIDARTPRGYRLRLLGPPFRDVVPVHITGRSDVEKAPPVMRSHTHSDVVPVHITNSINRPITDQLTDAREDETDGTKKIRETDDGTPRAQPPTSAGAALPQHGPAAIERLAEHHRLSNVFGRGVGAR